MNACRYALKRIHHRGSSAQRRKIYLIEANNLNTQQLAFASTVNIASGDMSETWGDVLFKKISKPIGCRSVHRTSGQGW
jgi:hypothetical protein